MSTLQEIKTATAKLPPREGALPAAGIMADKPEPETRQLEAALERGMADVAEGRVRPAADASAMIRERLGKS